MSTRVAIPDTFAGDALGHPPRIAWLDELLNQGDGPAIQRFVLVESSASLCPGASTSAQMLCTG